MVESQCSEIKVSPRTFIALGELRGPLALVGFAGDVCMLRDEAGSLAAVELDQLADEYVDEDLALPYDDKGTLLSRLGAADAFRIGLEWAWRRQNANLRHITEALQS